MANPYCTPDQLLAMYDRRVMLQLSGDDNNREGQPQNIQTLLDMQASELESYLSGMYALPLASVPLVLSKWVAATTAGRLYGRRTDIPKQVEADLAWADAWVKGLQEGRIAIPNIARATQPALQDSDFVDGRSRFDYVFGGLPSPTGPSKGM